jgi:uncharacterized membrane protein
MTVAGLFPIVMVVVLVALIVVLSVYRKRQG